VTKITFQIIAVIFLLLFLILHTANAQQDVASLSGEVTDSSGAQVADATVKILDTRTGSEIETKTESDGSYRFLRLQPGPGYTLTVSKDGFQTYSITNLYLAVATTRTQNVQLEVGGVNQTVEVISEGSVTLNTTDSTIGNNFDLRAVGSLPIEFRDDPSALLRLQPGVVNAQSEQVGANSASDPSGSRDGSVAGARADQNNITVDGIDATDFAFGQSFRTQAAIPVEAVQEFSTQVADITPAYGGRGGAQTIITTKSGTNNWHGSAHEYNRTALTEANTFFNNAAGVPRTNLVRNQFGADLGGPVKHDKLFFFFDYEGRRDAQQINELQLVPLPHVKNGQLAYINATSTATGNPCPTNSRVTSQDVSTDCVTILSAAQVAALDPCSQAGGCPNSPGFTAPGVAPALLNLFQKRYPAPNDFASGDGVNTAGFRFNAPNPLDENSYLGRFDFNINTKHKLFGRVNFRNQDSINQLIQFPGDPLTGPNIVRDYAWVIGETWTISPRTVNQLILGETRSNLDQPILFNPSGGMVELSFFGGALATPFARQSQIGHISSVPTFRDDVTLLRGHHTIQFGVQFNPTKVRSTLTNNFDFIQEGLGGSIASLPANLRPANILQDPSGIAAANWDNFFVGALGIINNDQSGITYNKNGTVVPQGTETHRRDYRSNLYAGYVQDTWKMRSDLTVTAGVRYQYAQVPYEVNGLQASFSNTTLSQILQTRFDNGLNGISGAHVTPELTYSLSGQANSGTPDLYDPDKLNFSPRLALAWNPSFRSGLFGSLFGDRKTVLRAQASLIYDQTVINAITNLEDQGNYVFGNTVATNFGGGGANASLQSDPRFNSQSAVPFPVVVPPFTSTVTPNAIFNYGVDNHLHTPYSETFSLGVQRELPGGFQVEVDFFGRYGRRLFVLADAAQLVDFTDPASKHTFGGDTTTLEKEALQHINPSNVAPLPFFENQLQAGTGLTCPQINQQIFGTPFNTCTQAVYALNQTALQQGNIGGVALGIFGLVPSNVVIPSQFFVNALGTNKGYSSYNAMFLTVRKRLSHNLQLDFNYTYSHSIDNSSIIANNNGNFVSGATQVLCNAYDLNACKGNSEFDATHQITSDFVYDLPIGRKQFLARNAPRWLDEIIGGWQASGIITWRTGLALDAVGGGSSFSLAADQGVNFTGSPSAVRSNIHTDSSGQVQFFADPMAAAAAFSPITGLTIGSRDTLRGPHFSNFDLGVAKNFPLFGEKYKLQFRADAFNAFNHPNFGLPNSGVFSSTFGVITNLAGQEPARVMQFALRFDF
jgi:hypothetical protein